MTPFLHTLEGINQDCENFIPRNGLKLCKLKENHVITTNYSEIWKFLTLRIRNRDFKTLTPLLTPFLAPNFFLIRLNKRSVSTPFRCIQVFASIYFGSEAIAHTTIGHDIHVI